MGIQNREYVREGYGQQPPGWMVEAPATRALIIITVAAFLGQWLLPGRGSLSPLEEWGVMYPPYVLQGQVWRLLTYAFLHSRDSVFHIIFNMLFLYSFGREMERLYGRVEFTVFYLVSAIVAGSLYAAWGLFNRDFAPMLGASGAVMATVMLYACHYPRQKVFLFGLIQLEIRVLVALYVLMDLLPVLTEMRGSFARDGIAHIAHLGGLLFGFLYYNHGWNLTGWWTSGRTRRWTSQLLRPSRRESLKVYHPEPEPENLDAEVDRILAKIHEQGTESLTRQERSLMERASQRYKDRK